MPHLFLKTLPRYECILEASQRFPDLDPSACEAFLHLLRTGDEVFDVCEGYLASHNLSQGRFTVLMQLLDKIENRPISRTPAELAERAGVARATMTGLIDTLERDGLVTRRPDPVDRRMMSVHLTARGEETLRSVLPGHFRNMAAVMGPLSEAERKTLVRLLTKVLTRVEAPAPQAVPVA
jgi:DNA-binding MarR family transcriptional regulator